MLANHYKQKGMSCIDKPSQATLKIQYVVLKSDDLASQSHYYSQHECLCENKTALKCFCVIYSWFDHQRKTVNHVKIITKLPHIEIWCRMKVLCHNIDCFQCGRLNKVHVLMKTMSYEADWANYSQRTIYHPVYNGTAVKGIVGYNIFIIDKTFLNEVCWIIFHHKHIHTVRYWYDQFS